jgi:hypothetical protein
VILRAPLKALKIKIKRSLTLRERPGQNVSGLARATRDARPEVLPPFGQAA